MAKGDVSVLGPYTIGDTTTMDTDITAAVGGKICAVTSYQDTMQMRVYFVVVVMEA